MKSGLNSAPLWSVVKEQREVVEPSDLGSEVVHYSIPSVDATGTGRIEDTKEIRSAKLRLRGGEVLISKLNPRKSRVVHVEPSNLPLVSSTEFVGLRCSRLIDRRFLGYLLQSEDVRQELDARVQSVTRSHQRVDPSDITHLLVSLPALEEQYRIIEFLDAETARINRLIDLRTQQISLHGQALMVRASELTGRTTLRKAGTSRLLGVPLRRAIRRTQTGTTPDGLKESAALGSEDRIPWYTPAALEGILSIGDADKYVDRTEGRDFPRFLAGSILVTGIGESLGKIGYLDHDATGNQQLTALEPNDKSDGRFLAWQLWVSQEEIRNWAQYSRVRIINNDVLKSFPIHLPTRDVQVSATKELDSQLDHTNRLRSKIERSSSLLTERRQALVTAAVTGHIDVSTASGRGIED